MNEKRYMHLGRLKSLSPKLYWFISITANILSLKFQGNMKWFLNLNKRPQVVTKMFSIQQLANAQVEIKKKEEFQESELNRAKWGLIYKFNLTFSFHSYAMFEYLPRRILSSVLAVNYYWIGVSFRELLESLF